MMDKIIHMFICSLASLVFSFVGGWPMGLVVALLSATVKEYIDQARYGGWSWQDLLADALGILVGITAYLIIVHIGGLA